MQYVIRALDASQQVQTVVVDALDEADARVQALAKRLTPLSVKAGKAAGAARRAPAFSLLLFAQELHALLSAGLSVIESIETLIEKDPQPLRGAILGRIARQLRDGQRLSDALRQQPTVFPVLFAGLVQAAEGTSDLPRALSRYIDYETRLDAVRHKVVGAAIYPAVLIAVGSAVSLFLLIYVVPRFASVYGGSGRSLPFASQLLLAWGAFVSEHAVWLLAAGTAIAALSFLWLRKLVAKGGWWQALKVLPGAASRLAVLELSRLYLTLGMLLEGGIPVHHALKLCDAVAGAHGKERLLRVRSDIEAGQSLSSALERHELSTSVAQRLLRVGEQSGQLGEMLVRTAAFYDEETSRWIERFTKTFEPVLMAAIGLVIGLIVILLYMPIFELAGSLQ